jgi:hypothetical protein
MMQYQEQTYVMTSDILFAKVICSTLDTQQIKAKLKLK